MLDVITHLEMAAADYRRLTTPNQFTITESAARENERLANQFQLAAEALRQMHNRLFVEGIVAGVKNIAASCEARRNRRASPASVPEGWRVSCDAEQETHREEENADGYDRLYLTVVDGAHSCSIWCWGSTQDIADEQARTIERLAAAPTPPISEDRKDAERWKWITRDGRTRELRIPANENKSSIDAAIDGAIIRANADELEQSDAAPSA